jgi:hypothetical protein
MGKRVFRLEQCELEPNLEHLNGMRQKTPHILQRAFVTGGVWSGILGHSP